MLHLPAVGLPTAAAAPPAARRPAGTHLPQLDALRGVATLAVLLVHQRAVPQLRWLPHETATVALGAFFVLSGFLITRILVAEKAAGRGLRGFYNRRAARIFPIYALTLLVLAVLTPGRELGWAANFTFNFRFGADARDYFVADAVTPPIAHTWSLCVEEHFYWLWPLAVALLPRRVLQGVLAAVIGATPAAAYLLADRLRTAGLTPVEVEGLLSRNTFTQLVGLSAGGLIALNESRVTRPVTLGISLLLATAVGWMAVTFAPDGVQTAVHGTIIHLLGCGCFLVALGTPMLGRRRVLVFAGTISYGLYLYHLPLYAALGLTRTDAAAGPVRGAVGLVATAVLSWVSFRYLEKPILARVRAKGPAGRRESALGVVLTFGCAAACAVGLAVAYRDLMRDAAAVPPAEAGEKREQLTGFGATVTTLVVGSSRTEFGVATPRFADVAYNLAFPAQDAWYDCQIVRAHLGRMPALKRIVFSLDSHTVHADLGRIDKHRWRQAMYFHAYGLRARADDESLYSPLAIAAAPTGPETMARLKRKAEFADLPNRGWFPADPPPQPFDPAYGKLRAKFHESFPPRLEENVALLIDTLTACRQAGIECVLVSVPTHPTYRDNLSRPYRAEATEAIGRVVAATGLPHLDFEADPRFETADYFDADHLNKHGAAKFTRLLEVELNRVCPLR